MPISKLEMQVFKRRFFSISEKIFYIVNHCTNFKFWKLIKVENFETEIYRSCEGFSENEFISDWSRQMISHRIFALSIITRFTRVLIHYLLHIFVSQIKILFHTIDMQLINIEIIFIWICCVIYRTSGHFILFQFNNKLQIIMAGEWKIRINFY